MCLNSFMHDLLTPLFSKLLKVSTTFIRKAHYTEIPLNKRKKHTKESVVDVKIDLQPF